MPRFDPNDYIDVQERINQFWTDHPNGAINTTVEYAKDYDHIIVKAAVWKERGDGIPDSTGIAGEERGPTGPNQTNWTENCETSAIGRALANMGYATSLKERPSRQEMEKVNRLSDQPTPQPQASGPSAAAYAQKYPPSEAQMKAIWAIGRKTLGMSEEELHQFAGVASLSELDKRGATALIDRLKALEADGGQDAPAPVSGGSGPITSWTEFYKEAKQFGVTNPEEYQRRVGKPLNMDDPNQALTDLKLVAQPPF